MKCKNVRNITALLICLLVQTLCVNTMAQDVPVIQTGPGIRQVPDSSVEKMKKDRDFLYANDSSYWMKEESDEDNNAFGRMLARIAQSSFLRLILYFFLAGVIMFAIYQVMIVNNFFIFSRGKRKKSNGLSSGADAPIENLDENIKGAIETNNYRLAIRYMYLKTLKLLSDNKFITLHAKSTNQDYLRQMYKHDGLSQFRHLTRIYEYVWYGEFDPSESQFDLIRTSFNRFNSEN